MSRKNSHPQTAPALVPVRCHVCVEHSGFTDEAKSSFCPVCQGAGAVERPASETITCTACSGAGKTSRFVKATEILRGGEVSEPCVACNATGRIGDLKTPYHAITLTAAERAEARLAGIEARLARIEALFT